MLKSQSSIEFLKTSEDMISRRCQQLEAQKRNRIEIQIKMPLAPGDDDDHDE